jgi:hypothetical protein
MLAVAGGALACAAVAIGASSKTISDPKHDLHTTMLPSGVHRADVDITKAGVTRQGGKIELRLTVDGLIRNALGSYDTSPVFELKVPGPTFYGVEPSTSKTGYSVFNHTTPDPTPPAPKLGNPNSHTLTLTFRPTAIGSPAKFKWYSRTGPCITYDSAPDTGYTRGKRC